MPHLFVKSFLSKANRTDLPEIEGVFVVEVVEGGRLFLEEPIDADGVISQFAVVEAIGVKKVVLVPSWTLKTILVHALFVSWIYL